MGVYGTWVEFVTEEAFGVAARFWMGKKAASNEEQETKGANDNRDSSSSSSLSMESMSLAWPKFLWVA
jgi:hypothetical protein